MAIDTNPPSASVSFPILDDTRPNDTSLPAFMVSTSRGFLPRADPVTSLPQEFKALETILTNMPIKTATGGPGLLANGTLGDTVLRDLPDLSGEVEKFKCDLPLMNALYRDYSFLASAYLLEPCHLRFVKGEGYGLARQTLPKNIALPIARVAAIAGFKPFMEYAGSYALFNYRLQDPSLGLQHNNLRLIRAFEHGLDPNSSEAGFVLVHVDMVANSGELIQGAVTALEGCGQGDREKLDKGLEGAVGALVKINKVMDSTCFLPLGYHKRLYGLTTMPGAEGMWKMSKPNDYTSFRTFIFGITSQSMFPNGVIYEGVSEEPLSFRGESGANDSMIPLCDNLLEIAMPATPLTGILKDFRAYRPGNHREFLEWVQQRATAVHLKEFALKRKTLYLHALNQVRDFRWRHWCFTREYILKRTSHPTATGGSPIVTWLPNQLQAVLDLMADVHDAFKAQGGLGKSCDDIMDAALVQQERLRKEVRKYCETRRVSPGGV
ncbi:hypothetical protein GP486_003697 [Trichoglossum hirsutum]|uniref:Indoleamine 2,3-dioxygenase n=1 Tax=Trichoglossum hirsutum TaxID=265104 RepID=A0A9P8RQA4_9PEZI|nr:hypothetical protein GP486_003697 [Trichoglossum hirsutum]